MDVVLLNESKEGCFIAKKLTFMLLVLLVLLIEVETRRTKDVC